MLRDYLIAKYNGLPNKDNVLYCGYLRITILTSHIIRVEYSKTMEYIDKPSQVFINRFTERVEYSIEKIKYDYLVIKINNTLYKFSKDKFVGKSIDNGLHYINKEIHNLGGTIRTLDMKGGRCNLYKGLISQNGLVIYDDSKSLLFDNDGMLHKREVDEKDYYIFSGLDYTNIINDFYKISGSIPIVPKYVFKNWWSRYYPYKQDEYINLMDEFKNHDIPLGVSVIDMDWHKSYKQNFVNVYPNVKLPFIYKNSLFGWTGYTVDKNKFYDIDKFFKDLHGRNLHITLNLHPAQGIWPHEEKYEFFKNKYEVGKKYQDVEFDFTNSEFINDYFEQLHYPLEEKGVDFWWIDWQQGTKSKLTGADPLFLLNHYHTLSNIRDNKRGLILSRYNGLGSHRYPLGFSGDSMIKFSMLNFIPYFTSTATNVGYTLWSHDIGSHMAGHTSNELYTRWIELGCFLPINRLHSSNSNAIRKEPWLYDSTICNITSNYLRLRHKLLPFIYSSYLKSINGGDPLIMPIYYVDNNKEAFKYNNSYIMGSDLLIHPFTTKLDKELCLSIESSYTPCGKYVNIFNGDIIEGGKKNLFVGELKDIPVYLKAGKSLPLYYDYNNIDKPSILELITSYGTDTSTMINDDGVSLDSKITTYTFKTSCKNDELSYNIENVLEKYIIIRPVDAVNIKDVSLNGTKLNRIVNNNHIIFTNDVSNLNILNDKFNIIDSKVLIIISNDLKDINIKMSGYTFKEKVSFIDEMNNLFPRINKNNILKQMYLSMLVASTDKLSALNKLKIMLLSHKTKLLIKDIINKTL